MHQCIMPDTVYSSGDSGYRKYKSSPLQSCLRKGWIFLLKCCVMEGFFLSVLVLFYFIEAIIGRWTIYSTYKLIFHIIQVIAMLCFKEIIQVAFHCVWYAFAIIFSRRFKMRLKNNRIGQKKYNCNQGSYCQI